MRINTIVIIKTRNINIPISFILFLCFFALFEIILSHLESYVEVFSSPQVNTVQAEDQLKPAKTRKSDWFKIN